MRRRKLLIGIGALSAGGSAALGTQAFSSVEAERSVDIAVAGDSSAFVAIEPLGTQNAQKYVDTDSGSVALNLDGDSDGPGRGVLQDAVTRIDSLFRVINQGSQPASIFFEDTSDAVTFRVAGSAGQSLEGPANAVELDVGEQVAVGLTIDTLSNDVSGQLLDDVTLHAETDPTAPGQGTPEPQYVVDGAGADPNTFATLSEALNSDVEDGSVIGIEGGITVTEGTGVSIDRPITVVGYNGIPTIDATGFGSDGGAIDVNADDVTLRNFELQYSDTGSGATNGVEAAGGYSGLTVDGLTVTNGNPTGQPAINVEEGADVTVTNNDVSGGAIGYFYTGTQDTSATIVGNFITANTGGSTSVTEGIFAYGGGLENVDFEIAGNRVDSEGSASREIKVGSPSSSTAASVNGETVPVDQLEALLVDNDIVDARVDDGTQRDGAVVTADSNPFGSSLQAVVDEVGSNGLALVRSGTFGPVSLDAEGLTLRGPNAGAAYDGARGPEARIEATDEIAVNLAAPGTEVAGLEIEGQYSSFGGKAVYVAEFGVGNEATVRNNIIRAGGDNFASGVLVANSSQVASPASATVEGNQIDTGTGTQAGAAVNVLSGPTNHASITVRGNELRGDAGGLRNIDSLTVENNAIFPSAARAPDSSLDIEVSSPATTTISNNIFTGDVGDLALDDDAGTLNLTSIIGGNTFEPGAVEATAGDDDPVIEFSSN